MATFSNNQVRHLYVAKHSVSSDAEIASTDPVGTIALRQTQDGYMYFEYKGAGGITRSDLIKKDNVLYYKQTSNEALATPLSRYKVTLNTDVNGGAPISGQDYLLRIVIRQHVSLSEEDQYFKYGMVHATSGMSPSTFYKTLALSLVKNFSREVSPLLKFYLETGGTAADTEGSAVTEVTTSTKESTLTDTYTGIIIEEAPQEWTLGVLEQTSVNFTLQPDLVKVAGDELIWGKVYKVASINSIPNGHKVADMEYFYMGERGDQYRNIGWPNVVKTNYLVNPDAEYTFMDIHYYYEGSNEGVQKSEKDITILAEVGTQGEQILNLISSALNS